MAPGCSACLSVLSRKSKLQQLDAVGGDMQTSSEATMVGLGIGRWEWDLAKGVIQFSQEWLELRGVGQEGSQSTVEYSYHGVAPDDRRQLELQRERVSCGQVSSSSMDFRVRRDDGVSMWVEERLQLIRDQEGRPARVVGCEIDITDRKGREPSPKRQLLRRISSGDQRCRRWPVHLRQR